MPKRKYLNYTEKVQINLYRRSETVVRSFEKKGKNYGVKKPTKGYRKLIKRQINQIKKEAKKSLLNST